MNFLADESVDRQIVDLLRREGHCLLSVAEMNPGVSDDAVLTQANREAAILLTADKDFGELVFRLGRASAGVVLIRLAGLPPDDKAAIVASAVRAHAGEFAEAFTVIAPGAVRIRRKLP